MNTPRNLGVCAIAALALGLAAPAAMAASSSAPDATISFHGGGVGLIAGVHWGSGTLHFQGKDIPVKVSGLDVGTVGASKYSATGNVYNLKQLSDIAGTYAAVGAGVTVAGGGHVLDMSNSAGVNIKAKASTAGLDLKLGPGGMTIKLK
jgi:hypothetical protein